MHQHQRTQLGAAALTLLLLAGCAASKAVTPATPAEGVLVAEIALTTVNKNFDTLVVAHRFDTRPDMARTISDDLNKAGKALMDARTALKNNQAASVQDYLAILTGLIASVSSQLATVK